MLFDRGHCSEANEAVTPPPPSVPSAVLHTLTGYTHTDALTDTMGCLPTSPITGLFIRVSYRQY